MKIQVRTLNQSKYEIEVDPSITIDQLKDIIEEKYQHVKSHQVLIFSGKVLANEQSIDSCNVKEHDFLVLMVKKPKGPPTPAAAAKPQVTAETTTTTTATPTPTTVDPTPSVTTTTAAPTSGPPELAQPEKEVIPPADSAGVPSASTADLYSQSASTLVTGTQLNTVADDIAAMGFPKDQVLLALRASYGNPDRALEYLLNGIPDSALQQPQQQPPARPIQAGSAGGSSAATGGAGATGGIRLPANILPPGSIPISTGGIQLPANILPPSLMGGQGAAPAGGAVAGSGSGGAGAGGGGGAGAPGVFDFLRHHPAFPQLRQIARDDPARLQEIMTRLVQQTPQLLPLIAQHQDEFIDLLREPGPAPGGIQIQVTPKDQDAINHLVSLGFSRNKAMEAYFLFEKDEQMAANYLLSYGNEEDEMEFVDDGGDDDDE